MATPATNPPRLVPVPGSAAVEAESIPESIEDVPASGLAQLIRQKFQTYRDHRNSSGVSDRIVAALRQYNGEYDADKLAAIRQFGGSEVYARLTTVKCRGATAMLRDVFLGNERTWEVQPTPVPSLPDDVIAAVDQIVQSEAMNAQSSGMPVDPVELDRRRQQLLDAAHRAAVRRANDQAQRAAAYIDDILTEGRFYDALADFLVDLPIFPYAVMKGPVVRMTTRIKWVDGVAQPEKVPQMFWERVAPENIWWTPAASTLDEASVIEKIKIPRTELNALLEMPGYFEDNIRKVLEDYDTGLVDWIDGIDATVADLQDKENPQTNRSEFIDTLEFHGPVQGKHLLELGFTKKQVPDPDRDYHITAWLVGRYIIKAQINPNPRAAKPYYITAFETMPGSLVGRGVPEIISDAQDVANACLRSLVNNMSISSGPQVAINEERLSPSTDADSLYPWKRWRFLSDPLGTNAPPIEFFQPSSNAQELLAVYKEMQNVADETSAIPRYITGSEKVGGAASTASGLSMLMNNASKVLQNVAAQIDRRVIAPALRNLYDLLVLTDSRGLFRGDEEIVVRGVTIAMQRETDRVRRLEFLQMTANPVDMQIVGLDGRAAVLRSVAEDLGLPGEEIVPSEDELKARQMAEQQAAMQQQAMMQQLPEANQIEGPREPSQIMQPPAPV